MPWRPKRLVAVNGTAGWTVLLSLLAPLAPVALPSPFSLPLGFEVLAPGGGVTAAERSPLAVLGEVETPSVESVVGVVSDADDNVTEAAL